MTRSELNKLAHSIAYETACEAIEDESEWMEHTAGGGTWWELPKKGSKPYKRIARFVDYLLERCLVDPHPRQRRWIMLLDESEANDA